MRRILDNPEAVMVRMADKLMKESKGRRISRGEMELELEENYFKTLKCQSNFSEFLNKE